MPIASSEQDQPDQDAGVFITSWFFGKIKDKPSSLDELLTIRQRYTS